ncbi:MAG: hypothetical protein GY778_27385 [bacterium]|nr:hypothetical protein [bacterium]
MPDPQAASDLADVDPGETTAALEPALDSDLAAEQTRQITAAGVTATNTQSNVVLENEVLTADSAVQVFSLDVPVARGGDVSRPTSVDPGQGGAVAAGDSVEQRTVEFEWPEEFRSGESGAVRLTLKALPGGIQVSSPEIPTNAVIATPILLTDCHDAYDARVTAQLVAPDFDIEASATATQVLTRRAEVSWRWTLTPQNEGTFVMTLALNMQWTLRAGATPTPTCQILAQAPFTFWGQSAQVEVNKVLGLITIRQASLAGTALAVLGFIGQVPFLGDVVGVLFDRKLDQRSQRRRSRR